MIDTEIGFAFLILIYILFAVVSGGLITGLFQTLLLIGWENSNKTKYQWWVDTLYLDDENTELIGYDKRHPKWYKVIQIFIGLTWPVYLPIIFLGFGAYYILWRFPIWIYKTILKEIYYWWIGDSKN